MVEAELRDITERAFEAYSKPLEMVATFKYLGRGMTAGDDNWPAVAENFVKERKSWGRLSRILIREGAEMRVSGNFFKAVVQAVLLFLAEMWVLTPMIERALESFMHGAAHRIMGNQPRIGGGGKWTYPPLKEAMLGAGFEGIRKAVTRRQNTDVQYITTQPILDLCERATHRVGARVYQRWWNQEGIYLKAAKERVTEALATDSESDSEEESEAEVETEPEAGEEQRSTSSGVSISSGAERVSTPGDERPYRRMLRKFTK